jgi:hypothetical protein
MCCRAAHALNAIDVHNGQVIKFIRVLNEILIVAGYIAITMLSLIISESGKTQLGLGIFLAATALMTLLFILSVTVNRRHRRAARSAEIATSAAASGRTKTYSAHASETYEHDAHTVWSLIRPAESAALLSDVQKAFTVPGTPLGVGEQQCFIRRDGSVSIMEIIGEESPWWSTTRSIAPGETNTRSTYRIEPTASGCTLTVSAIIELPANAEIAGGADEWWQSQMRPYLTRVKEVLSARQP